MLNALPYQATVGKEHPDLLGKAALASMVVQGEAHDVSLDHWKSEDSDRTAPKLAFFCDHAQARNVWGSSKAFLFERPNLCPQTFLKLPSSFVDLTRKADRSSLVIYCKHWHTVFSVIMDPVESRARYKLKELYAATPCMPLMVC